MPRRRGILVLAMALAACKQFDDFLEGPVPPSGKVAIVVASSSVTLAQGSDTSVEVTVYRQGDVPGSVSLAVEGLPDGATATVTSVGTGPINPVTMTLKLGMSTPVGQYSLRIRSHAAELPPPDVSVSLILVVKERPAFVLTPARPSLTITRGGIAPIKLSIARTNLTAPITFSVGTGVVAGITASFAPNPSSSDSTRATVSVAGDVPVGDYTIQLRGAATAAPGPAVDAPITVTVIADAIQLLAPPQVKMNQASALATEIIVNTNGFSGAVTLSADNLPAGVTASFQAGSSAWTRIATFTATAAAQPGTYTVTLRGAGTGVPDATTTLSLVISASTVSVSVAPSSVSVFPGTRNTTFAFLSRTGSVDTIAVTAENVPSGLTITTTPPKYTGDTVSLSVLASNEMAVGEYPITIRAMPVAAIPAAPQTTSMTVIVRPAPPGGNVLLDWTRCTAPAWVAFQDGTGPWTQAPQTSSIARFNVTSSRGAFAYVLAGTGIFVRYMSLAEMTASAIDMCPAAGGTKTVVGTAVHKSTNELFQYRLGGGGGTSTQASPNFTISGVREGTHDLLVWGTNTPTGTRTVLRRDINVPDGATIEQVDMAGPDSFTPVNATVTVQGTVSAGESLGHSLTFLTTPACIANTMYSGPPLTFTTNANANFALGVLTIPDALVRTTDFHMVTLTALNGVVQRTSTATFRALSGGKVASIAPSTPLVFVSSLSSQSYLRLNATFGTFTPSYNGGATFTYIGNGRIVSIVASNAYSGTTNVSLALPDFTNVAGWSNSYGMAPTSHGTWTSSLVGASAATVCGEAFRTFENGQKGSF